VQQTGHCKVLSELASYKYGQYLLAATPPPTSPSHLVKMRTSAICATLLSLATVQAGVLQRKNAAPAASLGPDDDALASAYLAGATLSGSKITTDNVTAATIRLYGFDGCKDMPSVDDAIPQIYSGWLQAQGIMDVQALKDGNVDFNTAGGESEVARTVLPPCHHAE
jgi:hypothetical protein